jgi:SAM-dependent methyltransferase
MKIRALEYLACPACSGAFTSSAVGQDEIETGELVCDGCKRTYPILRGVPRLLPGTIEVDKLRTADAFGWEWQEFTRLHGSDEVYHEQFLDWIDPIQPDFFRNKVVLDGGCGMGRFSAASAAFGARDVLAIDLSDAVEAAYENTKHLPNVHVVQADIYHLPFARPFDFAFSIGVLHHLPDPEGGFRSIVGHLKPGGSVFAWVYGRENNGWIVHIVNPLRERLFSRLPHGLLYGLSWIAAVALQPTLKLFYRGALSKHLPYGAYMNWLSQFGLRHNHHVIFDHLGAPTAFYLRREEFKEWFQRASLSEPVLSWRNENSWRGWGTLAGNAGPGP